MAFAQYLLACFALGTIHVALRKLDFRKRARGHQLPPSRPGYPLLGNILEFPSKHEHIVYRKWANELNSDVFYINAAGTPIVVVNSVQLATEMLEGRSSIYSGRPNSIIVNELMGWDWALSNMSYGDAWKECRKLFQRHFAPSNISFIRPHEREQIDILLVKLFELPTDFRAHIRHLIGSLAISFTYGLPVQRFDDPYVRLAETALETATAAAVPGKFYVDFIQALKYVPEWFPGADFQRKAKEWKALGQLTINKTFNDSESHIATGVARPSFMSNALDTIDPTKDIEHQRKVILETAGMVFVAAADTTTSALTTFVLAMMCYPEVQKRAQAELDRILGGRLPEAGDESQLPYITAIVKEVLRWHPATPINIPHTLDKDDIFHGYFIPKGTIIIPNAWAMLHNEDDYHNPDEFIPERFLDREGGLDPSVRDPSNIAFGFGRRMCPGSHIAQSTLWLTAASILTLFDISKPVNSEGETIEPCIEYGPGIISHPDPFECVILPRSKRAEEAIRALQVSL